MRALLKVGAGLTLLAMILIGLGYGILRANGVTAAAEGRQLASQTREVPRGIAAVELSGPIDLTLRSGTAPSLKVSGAARLLDNVDVSHEGGVLHIGLRGMVLRQRSPLQVELVLPRLASVVVSGSGASLVNGFSGQRIDVRVHGPGSLRFNGRYAQVNAALSGSGELDLNAGATIDRAEATLSGSGSLIFAGHARELHATVSGSGELDARHLRADSVKIEQTGSGQSTVQARQNVAAALSGSGDIVVRGNPAVRSISRSGTGSVTFLQ
jgi:hypothetical protein